MHFYPSLTEKDILAMRPQKVKFYIQGMNRVKAKERLELMDVAQYPYIKNSRDKQKKHRAVYQAAYPEKFEKKPLKTTDLELI